MNALTKLVSLHKQGIHCGIYSVCSANPLVLKAAMLHASRKGELLLIEATSNQVNQDGGYTGMTPGDFKNYVLKLCDDVGFSPDNLILGGDHLGPNCWQHLDSEEALEKSEKLIYQYVAAGFSKIHLDCSMSCKQDPIPLSDMVVAARAARLCKVAETASQENKCTSPVYVIGTEVPVPGGALEDEETLKPTSAEAAKATLAIHKSAFEKAGLLSVWNRVIALVVQPGVEFASHSVHHYQPEKATELSKVIEQENNLLFEAHSTDYQSAQSLHQLVKDHFAILKVGPWLTFAMREAIFSLADIEDVMFPSEKRSNIKSVLLQSMQQKPEYWQKYYSSEPQQQKIDCYFSLSDRIRYFWPTESVKNSLDCLFANLNKEEIPLTLISQYFPLQFDSVNNGTLTSSAENLVLEYICTVLNKYSLACQPNS